ncbi:class II fructose-1,6-bisphosphate aldolase [Candidatus Woesearchaeota archaeon]|nr:class II fructose-1,6-bisphosphate aldolase [Candidatus Woesearchaeota archaeon]
MLATGKSILDKANRGRYAVGAFNINNMEFLQAIINACDNLKSPVIIATSQGAIKYAGMDYLKCMTYTAAENTKVPVCLHLDHGTDMEVIKKCINMGWTSVMIDASHYDLEKNVKLTKKVVSMAHNKNVSVEAELGTIGGKEDQVSARKIIYTDPDKAVEFVDRTGCDSLAVAIGTSHGPNKFAGKAKLNFDVLKEIDRRLKMPLVLHGASGLPKDLVSLAKKWGVKLGNAHGVDDTSIRKAVKHGINKINTDTDLRIAFDAAVRKYLKQNPADFDPRKILAPARDLIQQVVEHRIRVFGSKGKA